MCIYICTDTLHILLRCRYLLGFHPEASIEDVMTELDLGPNGALLYAMEYIEASPGPSRV